MDKISKEIEIIFENIQMFKYLHDFQHNLKLWEFIYCPTNTKAFEVFKNTGKETPGGFKRGNFNRSAMSWIFSSCELVLILIIVAALGEIDTRIIPINYESDGLLLMGEFENTDQFLKELNLKVQNYANNFIQSKIIIEAKNIY